ncbi:MAG TPA: 5-methyltetrahydropteroyltriglutamate--homocysteine S-methyltransferase, partial [Chloroflexota bacterium]
MAKANNLGYPRIGKHRELKRAIEGYWSGKSDADELMRTAAAIRRASWETQRDAGIELIPSNDFSLYDQVLDTVATVGAVPERYGWDSDAVDLDTYFAMARGAQREGLDVTALEMTKWFDTNYHYLVPELTSDLRFHLASTKAFDEFEEAKALGITTKPVLLGPVSFLLLGKSREDGLHPLDLLDALLPVYRELVAGLAARGAEWIQLDEPCFVQDRTDEERTALRQTYDSLQQHRGTTNLLVQTYFGSVAESYETLIGLPVQGIGLDFVRGRDNLDRVVTSGFPHDKHLAAGLVDGRNVWIADFEAALDIVGLLSAAVSPQRLFINPSSSLQHVPIDVRLEEELDPRLVEWLAFAEQKLAEVQTLTRAVSEGTESVAGALEANEKALQRRRHSQWVHHPEVKARVAAAGQEEARRGVEYAVRREAQRKVLDLPLFPTTTIGSFPQTPEVRRNRSRLQKSEITQEEHDDFIAEQIRTLIAMQEEM